jgi:hypothetical protein
VISPVSVSTSSTVRVVPAGCLSRGVRTLPSAWIRLAGCGRVRVAGRGAVLGDLLHGRGRDAPMCFDELGRCSR